MTVRDSVAYSLIVTEHAVLSRSPEHAAPSPDVAVRRAFAIADAFVEHSTSDWARDERKLRDRAKPRS